jgi:hypothetical protein
LAVSISLLAMMVGFDRDDEGGNEDDKEERGLWN